MKTISVLLVSFFISMSLYSQTIISDTAIVVKERSQSYYYIRKPWAFEAGVALTALIYDSKTVLWMNDVLTSSYKLEVERENIFFSTNFHLYNTSTTDDIVINHQKIIEGTNMNSLKYSFKLGYRFNLAWKTTVHTSLGIVKSDFIVLTKDYWGNSCKIPSQMGYLVNVGINQYFKMAPHYYCLLFLDYNLNYSNYSKLSSDLGNTFHSIDFGIAFKFWNRKQVLMDDLSWHNNQ